MGKTKAKKAVREVKSLRRQEKARAEISSGRCCRCCRCCRCW